MKRITRTEMGMGTRTGIEWADHTWNPWQGCTRVSAGCANCYMYREKKQYGQDATVVRRSAPVTFNAPLAVDHKATTAAGGGLVYKWRSGSRVFVCSWSDFFHPDADGWRSEAWDIMRRRDDVTFMIPTKRAERILDCVPEDWSPVSGWLNVWLLASVEDQERVSNWEALSRVPAIVRGISYEPALGPLDWAGIMRPGTRPNWVICGGESGPGARPLHPDWARLARDACYSAGVPFFFK